MSYGDMRTYRTFEEFEREEIRRMDAVGNSVDEMIDTVFGEELELDFSAGNRRASVDEDDEE
jgi:ASC-1-like (ASCH) protein